MKLLLQAVAPVALLAISGCAVPFSADVSRFQQMPAPQGQTFTVTAEDPHLRDSLEFDQYARLVSGKLVQQGYAPAASAANANLVVSFDYGIDKGRDRIRSVPGSGGFGGRFGLGYGWGPYSPYFGYGRRAFVYGFNDPFLFGGFNDSVESYTVYQSQLDLKIERRSGGQRVFEGSARAVSTDRDLTTIVPNLIEAMFTNFPGNSGKTVRITVAPPEKSARK